jgi:hypothetical protein
MVRKTENELRHLQFVGSSQAERTGVMNRIEVSHSRAAGAMAHGKSHKAKLGLSDKGSKQCKNWNVSWVGLNNSVSACSI